MENKYECPICLSTKKHYNGKSYEDCTLCDEEGTVSKDTYELYCGEEEI